MTEQETDTMPAGLPLRVAGCIAAIMPHFNSISGEDLDALLSDISTQMAIGPLIDPTAWRDQEGVAFDGMKTVLRAMRTFKREVAGIGRFQKREGGD